MNPVPPNPGEVAATPAVLFEEPFFHEGTGSVRFWVQVDAALMACSVSREALHYRYKPSAVDEDPMQTYSEHVAEIEAAVRHRLAEGAREPVMLREYDLRVLGGA